VNSHHLELLQNLQDAYASLCNLSLLTLDPEGHPLTQLSSRCPLTDLVVHASSVPFYERVRALLPSYAHIEEPIYFDAYPPVHRGLRCFLAPVRVREETVMFLLGGAVVERGARAGIRADMENPEGPYPPGPPWLETLAQVPDWDEADIARTRQHLLKMVELIEMALTAQYHESRHQQHLHLIYDLSTMIEQHESGCYEVLQRYETILQEIDFCGLARKQEGERYEVFKVFGDNSHTLLGKTFSTGEGFLGQVALTGRAGSWEHLTRDPRAVFFNAHDVAVDQLFCYPIKREGRVMALFFGGSAKSGPIYRDIQNLGQIVATLLGAQMVNQTLQREMNDRMMTMTTILEIFHSLTVVSDSQTLLTILVDTSLHLLKSSFGVALLRREGPGEIVTRGLDEEQERLFRADMVARFFAQESRAVGAGPTVLTTPWGQTALVAPILYQQDVLGVLAIGLPEQLEPHQRGLFTSLVTMAGLTIHHVRTYHEQPTRVAPPPETPAPVPAPGKQARPDRWATLSAREKQVLELVVKGLSNREIAEQLFISDHTVKNHITNIFSKLGVTDRVQAITRAYESGYGR